MIIRLPGLGRMLGLELGLGDLGLGNLGLWLGLGLGFQCWVRFSFVCSCLKRVFCRIEIIAHDVAMNVTEDFVSEYGIGFSGIGFSG